jgi:indole-3-glycerol phosphate synthase
MNILENILAVKRNEVASLKQNYSFKDFEQKDFFQRKTISLKDRFASNNNSSIIAEFKRKSPSKGIINKQVLVKDVVRGYAENGAAAISILTDNTFFGGCNEDILQARDILSIPILRKEFIIDEIQLLEAKAIGADVVLLIATCLSPLQVMHLAKFAKSLQLEVLLELHHESELSHICNHIDFVGINNRNLKTFEVDLEQSVWMKNKIEGSFFTIAESGIRSIKDMQFLKKEGFDAFLIGELFMKEVDPIKFFSSFVKKINNES